MDTFPDIPGQGYKCGRRTVTLITPATSPKREAAAQSGNYIARKFELNWNPLTSTQAQDLQAFHQGLGGNWAEFYFWDWSFPRTEFHTLGTFASGTIPLPVKGIQDGDPPDLTVYFDGVAKAETTDYIFHSGDGPGGVDQVEIVGTKSPAVVVTVLALGRHRWTCLLDGDTLAVDLVNPASMMFSARATLLGTESEP